MTAQPLIALAEAQAVRRERAALKRRLAATRPRAAAIGAGLAVLASPTPRVAGMSIRELLARSSASDASACRWSSRSPGSIPPLGWGPHGR